MLCGIQTTGRHNKGTQSNIRYGSNKVKKINIQTNGENMLQYMLLFFPLNEFNYVNTFITFYLYFHYDNNEKYQGKLKRLNMLLFLINLLNV